MEGRHGSVHSRYVGCEILLTIQSTVTDPVVNFHHRTLFISYIFIAV